jgi:uncharacterized membrane protein/predicted DsbA family dithiol-disulfide isomerase
MESQRNAVIALGASLVPAAAGIAASAMLLVDYVRPAPVFCAESSGCAALKHTVFAAPMGVPLPLVGLLGFVALAASALVSGRRARMAQLGLAFVAGLVGVVLLSLQVLVGHFCPYCTVADASGLASLAAAAWRYGNRERDGSGVAGRWRIAGAGTVVAAAAVPLVAGFHVNTTPKVIHDEIAQTRALAGSGEVTVVDFVDFECPFCRMTHSEMQPVLESHRSQIRLVRRQVPLQMHPHARDAARAACCGERLGQGDAMADALFTVDVDELTPAGCEKIAERLGLPLDAYRACVQSPATEAAIDADRSEFKAAGGFALPTIWIDETPLVGAQPRDEVDRIVGEAIAKRGG